MSFFQRPIHHLNVTVPNLAKALDFYTKVLNFKVVEQYKKGDMDFVFISDGTLTYELMENASISQATLDHIAYVSDDIEADYEYFKNINPDMLLGEIGFADFLFENGMYYFFIKGAGGERIEFCQTK